ncbi:MAG TPA: hypothetical protein VFV50_15735 [Bdellovibrionales bacterium]|nr:hypothetical protein [Bdellovibrionales bacterium]
MPSDKNLPQTRPVTAGALAPFKGRKALQVAVLASTAAALVIYGQPLGGGVVALVALIVAVRAIAKAVASSGVPDDPIEEAMKVIRTKLNRSAMTDGLEKPAETALDQLVNTRQKMRVFQTLIHSRLNPGELTRERFERATHTVFMSVIDNLEQVSECLLSVSTASRDLREKQLSTCAEILGRNAKALEELDRMNVGLTEMKTSKNDFELALEELERLAQRAKLYQASRTRT